MTAFALTSNYLRKSLNVPEFDKRSGRLSGTNSDIVSSQTVKLLPNPLPVERLKQLADGNAHKLGLPELVATVGYYSLAMLRWEPRNVSSLHAAIPRPGGGPFCSRLYLSVREGERAHAHYLYEPTINALCRLKTTSSASPSTRLSLYADLGRIADSYGDFTLTVASIEAGHCAAQILMLLSALGKPATWTDAVSSGLDLDATQVEIGGLECHDPGASDAVANLKEISALVRSPRPAEDYAARFPVMIQAAEAIKRAPRARCFQQIGEGDVQASPELAESFLHSSHQRSSGLQGEGFVPRRAMSKKELHQLLEEWRRLAHPLPLSNSFPVETFISIIGVEGVAAQFSSYDLRSGVLQLRKEGQFAAILKRNVGIGQGYNLEEFSLAVLMSCPLVRRIRHDGPAGYSQALFEAGAIGQAFLLAATKFGMFARPFRAYEEAVLEQTFGIEDQFVYLILCGFERIANPRFNLLP